jgi:2-iminobutanoate/2-iminopropanoate deaminase
MRRTVASPEAPKAIGPYSQAVLVESPAGRTLHCSGQIPLDPATGELVGGDAAAQAEQVLRNVEAVLAAVGMGFGDVVKSTVYLVDLADFAAMNEVYGRRFPSDPPARSTVQVAALPRGARVEVEVLAVSPAKVRRARARKAGGAGRRAARRGPTGKTRRRR